MKKRILIINQRFIIKIKHIYQIIYKVLKNLFLPISCLLILFLKISKTKKKIKFFPIVHARIGHLAANTELFLRRLNAGYVDNRYKYIGVSGKPCNRQLLNMFKREISIIENKFLRGIITSPIFQKSTFFQDMPFNSNDYYEFNDLAQVIKFTPEEEERGIKELKKMGIGPQDWFICFHNRDSKYLARRYNFIDWSYHNYRDCNISNFISAMEYIASIGGYAIRMGHIMGEKFEIKNNPRIIDCSEDHRSDFMDIYLSSHCKFFVGCTAGLHLIPAIFGIPLVGTNWTHLEFPPYRKGDLFIPKKIKDKKENKLLTFQEIFQRRIGSWLHSQKFDDEGLEALENEPSEILAVVAEMNSILDGTYKYTEEDDSLQKQYWSYVKPYHHCYKSPARVGREFLIQNRDLLSWKK